MAAFRRANRFFARARDETGLDLPVAKGALRGLPVAIECRNRTNFYHFLTESLPQLVHFADSEAPEITFHCRNADPSGFSQGFIEALFPRIAPRLRFADSMTRYDRAIIPLNFRHMVYANGDPRIAAALAEAGHDVAWRDLGAHVRRRKFLFKNSYDVSLRLLREHALAMIDPGLVARMPRRIWVSRDSRASINRREMPGEKRLVRRLEQHGFEQVYFEHMSPMEQIAAIHAADVIGAAHGAFFGHMIFARPDAHVIEVGSIQTQMHRWGDFLGNAHAGGCRYSTVFADTASDDPADIRSITEGLIGVQVGDAAIDLICRLAVEGQPD